jgi:hypothetical protein
MFGNKIVGHAVYARLGLRIYVHTVTDEKRRRCVTGSYF